MRKVPPWRAVPVAAPEGEGAGLTPQAARTAGANSNAEPARRVRRDSRPDDASILESIVLNPLLFAFVDKLIHVLYE
jgi:hypothetical protein